MKKLVVLSTLCIVSYVQAMGRAAYLPAYPHALESSNRVVDGGVMEHQRRWSMLALGASGVAAGYAIASCVAWMQTGVLDEQYEILPSAASSLTMTFGFGLCALFARRVAMTPQYSNTKS